MGRLVAKMRLPRLHLCAYALLGLLNSNLDLAGADGISETLAIGDLAGGPMSRWADGSLAVGIPGLGRL